MSHLVGNAGQPSQPLSCPSPPAFNLSQHQGLFQWVSTLHQVVKYWSFSFSIGPSNEYSGLISFRIDWFDFLAVQGTLKSLPQHHSSKASILWCSGFFFFFDRNLCLFEFFLFFFFKHWWGPELRLLHVRNFFQLNEELTIVLSLFSKSSLRSQGF